MAKNKKSLTSKYIKFKPIGKFIIWPIVFSCIIWFTCHSDQNIRQLNNIDELLKYFEGISGLVFHFLGEFKCLIVIYILLYILSKALKKCANFASIIFGVGVMLFLLILFMLALVMYIGTLTETTVTIIPIYYVAVVTSYDWFENVYRNIFLIGMKE